RGCPRFGEGLWGGGDRVLVAVAGPLARAAAARHPFLENAILPGVFAEADAAGVLDLACGFEQEQTAVGIGNAHAPAQSVAGHVEVVALRLEAEQGQAKA